MSRSIFLVTITCLLLLAALVTLRGDLLVIAIPFMVFLFHGMLFAPGEINVTVERRLNAERTNAHLPVVVHLMIHNLGKSMPELILEDAVLPDLVIRSGSPRHVVTLGREGTFSCSYSIEAARGVYAFESLHLTSIDPTGLFPVRRSLKTTGRLSVYPKINQLGYVAIRPRRTRAYAGSVPARLGGAGIEFFGVREYQAGDPPRAINWRAAARHPEQLFTNEFQQERAADVGFVLDGRERTNLFAGASLFEHSLEAALALANAFLNQGNRVGLLVYGKYLDWTLPGYGKIQRERILQALARARLGASTVFAGLEGISPRMFPAESQIVLISSLVGEDLNVLVQLRARGYQVLVLSPDPVSYESGRTQSTPEFAWARRVVALERSLLIRRLLRAGVQVIEWDTDKPLDQSLRPLLKRYRPFAPLTRLV